MTKKTRGGPPTQVHAAIALAMERTRKWREEQAAARGVKPEEVDALEEEDRRREDRMKALVRSGVALPVEDLARIASDELAETEPLDLVQRWWGADLERPILLLCGAVGVGKTLAAAWAVAACGGGSVIHAPELARRILPTRTEIETGFDPVNLRTSLLVLDDLGTEADAGGARWSEAFALLVERRIMVGRTIVTSNMGRKQFRPRYGDRIASRLNAHAYVVELREKASLRKTGGGL